MDQDPVQSPCNVTAQLPSAWQHEPVGCWQMLGSQVPNIVQLPLQSACNVTAQVPSTWQHDPLGCVQGFGSQTPFSVHVPAQLSCVVTLHVPSWAQHEPFCSSLCWTSTVVAQQACSPPDCVTRNVTV